jgi:hypothetical protein
LDGSNKNDYHLLPEYAKLHSTQRAEQELCMNPSFSASEAVEDSTTGGLRTWERLMRRGLDAARGECADDRIAAFVVTHLNLSDLRRDAERIEDAVAHLGEHCGHPAILAALRAGCMPFPPPGITLH